MQAKGCETARTLEAAGLLPYVQEKRERDCSLQRLDNLQRLDDLTS